MSNMGSHLKTVMMAVILLMTMMIATVMATPEKCGPCLCEVQEIKYGDGPELLLNCSDVPAAEDGAFPMPDAAAVSPFAQSATYARVMFERTGAKRLVAVQTELRIHTLDLSDNRLAALVDGVLHAQSEDLVDLRLPGNRLTELNDGALRELRALRFLDVSRNSLESLDLGALPPALRVLRAANNSVTHVKWPAEGSAGTLLQLKELDLSNNLLTDLDQKFLPRLPHLARLRLAGNQIRSVDPDWATGLTSLEYLDVTGCGLEEFKMASHFNLAILRLAKNRLKAADVDVISATYSQLIHLDLSENELTSFPITKEHKKLKKLNLSGNALESLPTSLPLLPRLVSLDLSGNKLATLPVSLGAPNIPALTHLWLDANEPLARLRLEGSLPQLRFLSASRLPRLRELRSGDLDALRRPSGAMPDCLRPVSKGDEKEGLELCLSDNPSLETVQEKAFVGLPLCELDLSGCALRSLPESATDWKLLRAVDLQRNPWACECSLQWLLDSVVAPAYERDNRHMLYELQCASPAEVRGRRLVHFYNWSQPLCQPLDVLEKMRVAPGVGTETQEAGFNLSASRGMLIALSSIGALFLCTVIAGLSMHYQTLARRRRQNRRL